MGSRRARAWAVSLALQVLGLLVVLSAASRADAYPWMIRHGYAGCTPCHTDPSGGAGVLTAYGRAQSDLLLRMRYGDTSEEASSTSGVAWGLIQTSDALRLGADIRESIVNVKAEGAPDTQDLVHMRADLMGDLKLDRFRAAGSIGYAPTGALLAAVTQNPNENVVAREFWLGYELDPEGAWLLRAGRIARPFGIRNIEHTLFTRVLTRSDFNDGQQYGAALAMNLDRIRGEVMGIAGNLQLHPDDYRERGYSAYVEYAPINTLAVGVSSQFTRANRDIIYNVTNYRQAHGGFLRYAPAPPLVILAEADMVYQSLYHHGHRGGYASFVQLDLEQTQGLHFMVTGELMNGGSEGEPTTYDGWLSGVWFFAPHTDLRFDGIYGSYGNPGGSSTSVVTWLLQLHVFL
jgi:hypothetical protein